MLTFELTVTGGIGERLIDAFPELRGLQMTHTRLVVVGQDATMDVAERLERAGAMIIGVNGLCTDGQSDSAGG